MSRRERDARDSRGRRLHSKFDLEPSPKKLKRDEKPEVDRAPSSQHHFRVLETSDHGQKRRPLLNDVPLKVPPASSTAGLLNVKKSLEGKGDRTPVDTPHSSDHRKVSRSREGKGDRPPVDTLHSSDHREVSRSREVKGDRPLVDTPHSSDHREVSHSREGKGDRPDRPPVDTSHSSDHREVSRSRAYYQHDDRGIPGQGGRNYGRRTADHGRWSDSKVESRYRARDETYDQPKKDERSQSHADEKTSVWRHDRFYELESGVPPARKRPSFSEKKIIAEPEGDAALMGSDKTKLPTCLPPELATSNRDERGVFYPRALDKPDRTFSRVDDAHKRRGDGFYQRGEIQRNANQSRDRYGGGLGGRGDRFNMRYGERDLNHAGGFEVEKWKHDLFDEANKSPPPKNEEEHIAKVEALLAL